MSARVLVVTGTDTGVGKTRAAVALLDLARALGIHAAGFKPVAAGCVHTADGWRNDDAVRLLAASAGHERYEAINPIALPAAIAPHLAAREAGIAIRFADLDRALESLKQRHELVIVEGAGGWRVPLGADGDFADWCARYRWPVLLVVGLRLGCLNHAALSAESIMHRTHWAGWLANRLPPIQPAWQDNLGALEALLPHPCLGVLPPGGDREGNRRALNSLAHALLRAAH